MHCGGRRIPLLKQRKVSASVAGSPISPHLSQPWPAAGSHTGRKCNANTRSISSVESGKCRTSLQFWNACKRPCSIRRARWRMIYSSIHRRCAGREPTPFGDSIPLLRSSKARPAFSLSLHRRRTGKPNWNLFTRHWLQGVHTFARSRSGRCLRHFRRSIARRFARHSAIVTLGYVPLLRKLRQRTKTLHTSQQCSHCSRPSVMCGRFVPPPMPRTHSVPAMKLRAHGRRNLTTRNAGTPH